MKRGLCAGWGTRKEKGDGIPSSSSRCVGTRALRSCGSIGGKVRARSSPDSGCFLQFLSSPDFTGCSVSRWMHNVPHYLKLYESPSLQQRRERATLKGCGPEHDTGCASISLKRPTVWGRPAQFWGSHSIISSVWAKLPLPKLPLYSQGHFWVTAQRSAGARSSLRWGLLPWITLLWGQLEQNMSFCHSQKDDADNMIATYVSYTGA